MKKQYKHLTWENRIGIDSYLKANVPIKKIAEHIGVSKATIYNEVKRGRYVHINSDLTTEDRYSPDIAEEKYRKHLSEKGRNLKIGNDHKYANFIEEMIATHKYSPKAVLYHIKENQMVFKTNVCFKTLYNYIDNGIFYLITNDDLPVKRNKKRDYRKIKPKRTKIFGESIEKRPIEVDERDAFGHWEMDCVVGTREKGQVLLVFTERLTRQEIIKILPEKKVRYVIKALDEIEKELGFRKFCKIFKTITVDNGSEFAGSDEFERSCISKTKKRTKIYFCHPYSSWERGSNENNNKLIRRHLPKGTDFKDLSKDKVEYIEDWVNNYPRCIFNGKSARDVFRVEIEKLGIVI